VTVTLQRCVLAPEDRDPGVVRTTLPKVTATVLAAPGIESCQDSLCRQAADHAVERETHEANPDEGLS